MAKIDTRALKNAPTDGTRVTIGNNRQVQKKADGETIYRLHGHPIVRFSPDGILTADCVGYRTVTTRAAITDFVEAHTGYRTMVSFAGGLFHLAIPALGYAATLNDNAHFVALEKA